MLILLLLIANYHFFYEVLKYQESRVGSKTQPYALKLVTGSLKYELG